MKFSTHHNKELGEGESHVDAHAVREAAHWPYTRVVHLLFEKRVPKSTLQRVAQSPSLGGNCESAMIVDEPQTIFINLHCTVHSIRVHKQI